jgi:hypothetical protein
LAGNPKLFRAAYIENKMPRNYVMQWNLNIQQQITPSVTAFIGYVGNHGVHMPLRIDDYDIVLPTLTPAGYLWPNPIGSGDVLNPNFGSIRGMFYSGSSIFHGLQLQGAFTWSKSIDDSSGTGYADQFSNSMSSLVHFDNRLLRGVSDFNIGRTLVINGIWQVPTAKSLNPIVGGLVNGWQVQSIFKVNDGIPFTPTFGTGSDPLGLNSSDDWDYPSRLSGSGCNSPVNPGNPVQYVKTQCFSVPTAPNLAFWNANCDPAPPSLGYGFDPANPGNPVAANSGNPPPAWLPRLACFNLRGNVGRNILTAPGLINMDFAVFKNNHIRRISETFNIQFRAEMFNILNRANFAPPVLPDQTDIFNGDGNLNDSAGQLISTVTDAREIQFGIKIVW